MNKKFQLSGFFILFSLALSAILVAGCSREQEIVLPTETTEITIPFETIEKSEEPVTGEYYEGSEPKLVVITKIEDIDTLGNTISTNAQERLRNLDYNQQIAIVVFQSDHIDWIGIEIQRVTLKNNLVMIEADITERNPEYEFLDTKLSPYHVISIPKAGLEQETTFELIISYVPQQ